MNIIVICILGVILGLLLRIAAGDLTFSEAFEIVFNLSIVFFIVIFWIYMLIDVFRRVFPDEKEKMIWSLIVFFGFFPGAVIYYFIVKRRKIGIG
jgi:hypothetical protein